MRKPREVQEARLQGNRPKLSAMGRKGAWVTNTQKDLIASSDAALAKKRSEQLAKEMSERALQANEHIVPVDDTDSTE
jgi:hypothetical protein